MECESVGDLNIIKTEQYGSSECLTARISQSTSKMCGNEEICLSNYIHKENTPRLRIAVHKIITDQC